MKRYQVYLEPHTVGVFDEASAALNTSRAYLIRELMDAAASRISGLLASFINPRPNSYSELDKLTDVIDLPRKGKVNLSKNIDGIYYR